jgi:hypothetical protein
MVERKEDALTSAAQQVIVKAPEFAFLVYNECKSRGFKPYWEGGSSKWTLSVSL